MAIKRTEVSKRNDVRAAYLRDLDKQIKELPAWTPHEVADALQEARDKIASVSLSVDLPFTQLKKLTGDLLTLQQFAEMVKEATGFVKWHMEDDTDGMFDYVTPAYLAENYGVDVAEDQIVRVFVSRQTTDRDAISSVWALLLPGHAMVEFGDYHATAGYDKLFTLSEVKRMLKEQD